MPCGFACFAYLGNVFALTASVSATGEIGQMPQRDQTLYRTSVSPAIVLSERSRRGSVSLSYAPAFTYAQDATGQRPSTISHRVSTSFARAMSAQTSTTLSASYAEGRYDAVGLRQQLQNTTNAGTPVTGGDFRSITASLGVNHLATNRWNLAANIDASLADSDPNSTNRNASQGSNSPTATNGTLIGLQRRATLALTSSYRLTQRLALQTAGIVGYQLADTQDLMLLSVTAGTGVALSKVTNVGVAAGVARIAGWPGETVERRYRAFGGTATASINHQLTTGRNATGFSFSLGWAPQYDPLTDRTRSRVTLGGNLAWVPARNWQVGFSVSASTPTDSRPADDFVINGEARPSPDTRIAFALPVSYQAKPWFRVAFGARANLPASNLSRRFEFVDPDIFGFATLTFVTPP